MADGRARRIADLRTGDKIYGTVRKGHYRRYVTTEVRAHWQTLKPGYRITLEDGTELVASGDHRFWTGPAKWKHVTGAEQGGARRPHLTLNDELVGTGQLASSPDDSPEYRRGYLCGMIQGDGHVGSYSYENAQVAGMATFIVSGSRWPTSKRCKRTRNFLADVDVQTDEFHFHAAVGNQREINAIRTSAKGRVDAIRELISWPRSPTNDWCKGFLAGIYDPEGSFDSGRIANTDVVLIDWITYCFRRLDFHYVVEKTKNPNGLTYVRIDGGLRTGSGSARRLIPR